MDRIDLIIYAVLIIMIIIIIYRNEIAALEDVRSTEVLPDDDITLITRKFEVAKEIITNSVIWRRGIVVSIVSAFFLLYIFERKLPSGVKLISGSIIIYIFVYLMLSYYRITHYIPLGNNLEDMFNKIATL